MLMEDLSITNKLGTIKKKYKLKVHSTQYPSPSRHYYYRGRNRAHQSHSHSPH